MSLSLCAVSFIAIAATALFLFQQGFRQAGLSRTLTVWSLLAALLAATGFFAQQQAWPPRFLLIPLSAIAVTIFLFRRLRNSYCPPRYLLALHGLRLPVELVLYRLFVDGRIPELMTFTGWNYDLLTGITALLLLGVQLSGRPLSRRLMIAWNIAGSALLLAIVLMAVLSAPGPLQVLAFGQANTALLYFPYTLLPLLVVPLMASAHWVYLRALLLPQKQ